MVIDGMRLWEKRIRERKRAGKLDPQEEIEKGRWTQLTDSIHWLTGHNEEVLITVSIIIPLNLSVHVAVQSRHVLLNHYTTVSFGKPLRTERFFTTEKVRSRGGLPFPSTEHLPEPPPEIGEFRARTQQGLAADPQDLVDPRDRPPVAGLS